MFILLQKHPFQFALLLGAILSFAVNGVHYLWNRPKPQVELFYFYSNERIRPDFKAWAIILPVSLLLGNIAGVRAMGIIVPLFCIIINVIALMKRVRKVLAVPPR
jgi:hypothetical protein